MSSLFFDGWPDLLRSIAIGPLAYVTLIIILRLAGKRTLAKMNAFDLVVTIALGSTLATIMLNKDVALAEGAVALAVLVVLQFIVAWTSVRLPPFRRAVRSEPTLLLHRGQMLHNAMRQERVTEDEVRSAIRASGIASIEHVQAVVLESDGSFSVIQSDGAE